MKDDALKQGIGAGKIVPFTFLVFGLSGGFGSAGCDESGRSFDAETFNPATTSAQFADEVVCPPGEDGEPDCTPSAYRVGTLQLRDPHAFAGVGALCFDVTGVVNGNIKTRMNGDEDEDGYLDASIAMTFRPMVTDGVSPTELSVAQCTAPSEGTVCSTNEQYDTIAYSKEFGECLAPFPGTTSGFSPSITTPVDSCFSTAPVQMVVSLANMDLDLEAGQLAARFPIDPSASGTTEANLTSGLMVGFLPESAADTIVLPDDLPIVGGKPFSSILSGGTDNCDDKDARDVGPDGVTMGWWMYLNFDASPVGWAE